MLQTMCLRHDVFSCLGLITISLKHFSSYVETAIRCLRPEVTSNTYKPLKITSNYVFDPVLETN
jgi:hypothetical protein